MQLKDVHNDRIFLTGMLLTSGDLMQLNKGIIKAISELRDVYDFKNSYYSYKLEMCAVIPP